MPSHLRPAPVGSPTTYRVSARRSTRASRSKAHFGGLSLQLGLIVTIAPSRSTALAMALRRGGTGERSSPVASYLTQSSQYKKKALVGAKRDDLSGLEDQTKRARVSVG